MMKENHISELVINKLWHVYGVQKQAISKNQRRGAIIVLGMLATADPGIVVREMDTMLRIGLGGLGHSDLSLAKYTFIDLSRINSSIALRRINSSKRQTKDASVAPSKLTNDHAVLTKLAAIIEIVSDSKEW